MQKISPTANDGLRRPLTPFALNASWQLLRLLLFVTGAIALVLVMSFVASFVFEDAIVQHFASRQTGMDALALVQGLRIFMLLGAIMIPLVAILLLRLLAIVGTVRAGNPFTSENAKRLSTVAWSLLGVQFVDLGFGAMASRLSSAHAQIEWTFSITGWVGALMAFVIAHVFAEGAKMREDLEGVT